MQKIVPHLWFDQQAQEAATFYTDVFQSTRAEPASFYTDVGTDIHGQKEGTVMTVEFELEGLDFIALNGGPHFTFTPAVSFMVNCPTKDEVDGLWAKLSDGGTVLMPLDSYPFSPRYGWIQDKYGLSWQLIFADYIPERKLTPSLMFTGGNCGKAEEAIHYYASVFDDSEVGEPFRYGPGQEPDEEGTVAFVDFSLEGQKFAAMDSARNHHFTFNEATSFFVRCEDQAEVDYYWGKLSADPQAEQCGWLKDKYGVSWQIIPNRLGELIQDPDPKKAGRVMDAILKMKKIDIEQLQAAYEGVVR